MITTPMPIDHMERSLFINAKSVNFDGLAVPDTYGLECQVLADLVGNPDMIGTARGLVSYDMFTRPGFQRLWSILTDMSTKGETIDISTVYSRVDHDTMMALVKVSPGLYTATMDHCRALADMSTRRMVFVRAYEMMKMAGNPGSDMAGLLSMPGDLVADLSGRIRAGASTQTVADILNEFSDGLQDQANGKVSRVPTGFPNLDKNIFGGWTGGNLIIMSARPSVGKSAIMLQMALEASRAGFPATVYSLEMPTRDLGQRLVLSTGDIRQYEIATDTAVRSLNWEKVERANGRFDNLPLWFNTRLRTMDEICNDITLQHQRGRCSVAFVDHLHIISGADTRQTTYQAITERTRRFKLLAMDLGIPVVVLCQLNRMSDNETRPPELRDLRDSGSIEQDADIVLMLARHGGNGLMDPNVDMWIRKNRNGVTGNYVGLKGDINRGFTVFYQRENDNESLTR